MSHSELASRFDDGPTVLYRALLKGLGLEAFEGIRECLAKAQSARRKQKSEAKDTQTNSLDITLRLIRDQSSDRNQRDC